MVNRRQQEWLWIGLTGLAFALRAVGLEVQSLWRDEVDALRFAQRPLADLLHAFGQPGQNGPLYFLMLCPWLKLAGQSEFALRFSSVVLAVVGVPLLRRFSQRLFPGQPGIGLGAGLLMVTSPYLVWYGQEGKMYAGVVTLAILSMERFVAALSRGTWRRWAMYLVVTGALFYVHLLGALIVLVQIVVSWVLVRRNRGFDWRGWLVSLAVLTIPYLPLLAWQVPLLLHPADTGFRFVPLPEMLVSLWTSYSLGVVQRLQPWTAALFGGVLVMGTVAVERRWRMTVWGVLLPWLLIPVVGVFLISLVRPLFTARYLILIMPAYLLVLAVGWMTVWGYSRLLGGLLAAVLLVTNGWGIWCQSRTLIKADFRSATRYVADRLSPDDLILFQIPYGRYSFEYYWPRPEPAPSVGGAYRAYLPWVTGKGRPAYRWAEGVYTNSGMDPDEVARRMTAITAGSRVVWLVASEVSLWDERGLVQAWLEEHGTLTEEARFVRVTVFRYEIRNGE